MKRIVYLLFFVVSSTFAQEILPIKGRIVSSVTRFRPMGQIEIRVKGTYEIHTADKDGNFLLYPKKDQEKYTLIINAGTHQELEYTYLSEWRKRNRPKSIVVYSNFNASKKIARQDFKQGTLKLYIQGGIAPIANNKEDDDFEQKYKISYIDFGCELKTVDALLDYNKRAFFFLDMTHGEKWRKSVRKDVVGL